MSLLNKQQLICINTLISKLQLQKHKPDIISGFSNGRISSSKELLFEEAQALIKYLKGVDPQEKQAETMRRKIISMAHEMGWYLPGTSKIDMKRLDDWCIKFGHVHKKLDSCTYIELPMLVSQFQFAYKHFLNNI